jgi:tRNA-dihydrouridine synthase
VDRLLRDAGAAAVMVGRAALGDPWLFADLLAGRRQRRRRRPGEVIAEMGRFYHDLETEMGPERAGRFMRKFYLWYLKPFTVPSGLRADLRKAKSYHDAEKAISAELLQRRSI